jgi:hypothetical protein
MASRPAPAALTADLIRRGAPMPAVEVEQPALQGWRADLRFFALTWATGFVAFSIWLA